MHIEHIWTHVLTPVFYAFLVLQIVAYGLLGASSATVFISTCIVAVAFAVTHTSAARPFHVERGAVFLALALAYLGVLASRQQTGVMILEHLHIHKGAAQSAVVLVYNALWMMVVFVTFIGFLWNPMQSSPLLWTAASLLATLLAAVPLEIDLATEPSWLVWLRFNVAFLIYVSVALSDSAYLLEYALFRRRKAGSSAIDDCASTVDVPFMRTVSWIALSLWPIFSNRLVLIIVAALAALLFYVTYIRWGFARHAHHCVRNHDRFHLQNHWARPGHVKTQYSEADLRRLGKTQLISVVTDLMSNGSDTAVSMHSSRGHRGPSKRPRATISALPDD